MYLLLVQTVCIYEQKKDIGQPGHSAKAQIMIIVFPTIYLPFPSIHPVQLLCQALFRFAFEIPTSTTHSPLAIACLCMCPVGIEGVDLLLEFQSKNEILHQFIIR